MGKAISKILNEEKTPYVVIENEQSNIDILESTNTLFVHGDGTRDECLLKAGIKNAKGFVAVLPNDAENVFSTLSAKGLNPNIFIVARAMYNESESKLLKAGANRVVKPYDLGGERMAHLLIRPSVIDFMNIVSSSINVDLNIEEVQISETSTIKNKRLNELPLRDEINIIVVSIIKKDGTYIYNPRSTERISQGDKLFVLGDKISLAKFNTLCS